MPRNDPKVIETISVKDFYESYKEELGLELTAGEKGLDKVIRDASINRPALAMVGYFRYFANKRIQLFGAGEMAFLRDMPADKQISVLKDIFAKHVPCVIISRNLAPTKPLRDEAEAHRVPLLRTKLSTREFIAQATLLLEGRFAPTTTCHGTLLDVKGIGVILRGRSGVGKSECALALIERGHSLVADDLIYCRLVSEQEIIGSAAELGRGYMECRGLGIINVADMFGIRSVRLDKRVDLVITFEEWRPGMPEERTGLERAYYEILGAKIPHIEIPVKPGRDMARLTEAAAMVQALRNMGHDSAQEFNDQLIAHMEKVAKPSAVTKS
ncbi:HPr(Ser) kinase/phosphatase [Cerasicoccus arenae]|uniref:HPr kinase/phosphorylase n=1 Tax=Cerasicoccus arenae TaxID=424488 RepID=A0A8J3DCC8_9BACT|nr:HPr(Ser) kinase/phosphatase [Cerasicoccus arenae]MBK1858420.1 HPr(Ser) kinase/phosphatase [Cerasicoccus arenae]GHC02446.1 HPr kinase/phosphorylase [Cerasicoccus arenae]